MKKIIIVGQGIAGTCFAQTCALNGIAYKVVDNNWKHASSLVAAGMWNPLVFRRLTKSWNIDTLLPFALEFYAELESKLKIKCVEHYRICRFFSSIQDSNDWDVKSMDPGFEYYMPSEKLNDVDQAPVKNEFGYGVVDKSGRVHLPKLLQATRKWLHENDALIEADFSFDELQLNNENIIYRDEEYQAIVFCEGAAVLDNPLFNWLPVQPNKGEVFTIHCPDLKVESLLNKGFFILPLKDDMYRVGATFNTGDRSHDTTDQAKEWLKQKLDKVLNCSYTIVDQKAGVRPTVADRRPLIGQHPLHSNVFLLNGLGTKGVSIAPLMSQYLMDSILFGRELPEEVDVKRFYTRYKV